MRPRPYGNVRKLVRATSGRTRAKEETSAFPNTVPRDTLAERLRRRPAKPMGSPRVGSNPTGVVCGNRVKGWGDTSSHQRGYRSHFGSRYKLGCCDHASLLGRGSNPPGGVSGCPESPNSPPATPKQLTRIPAHSRTGGSEN